MEKLKAQNNPTINNFVAIPFSPSNSIIISANEYVTSNIKQTLDSLDRDVKSDDSIDVVDVVSIVNSILGLSSFSILSDVNSDNITNVIDVIVLVNIILN